MTSLSPPVQSRYLSAGLWLAQIFVSLVFIASGSVKLFTPLPELTAMMTWPGDYPAGFVRSMALVDLAGGLGLLLPSLTRIRPRLSVLAALCCAVLQMLAIAFHASRGEFTVLPLNFVLLPLCLLVLWGRARKIPIKPRAAAS